MISDHTHFRILLYALTQCSSINLTLLLKADYTSFCILTDTNYFNTRTVVSGCHFLVLSLTFFTFSFLTKSSFHNRDLLPIFKGQNRNFIWKKSCFDKTLPLVKWIQATCNIRNPPGQSEDTEAFAEAHLHFIVFPSAIKMPRQLNKLKKSFPRTKKEIFL